MAKGRKIKQKRVLLILGILLLGFLSINWFLTTRLESYLNARLSGLIAESTQGFYDFSFDKLSVAFLTGELVIEGIVFKPNEERFKDLEKADSLPPIYFDIAIDKVDLQGINLIWRVDYTKFKFDLFELQRPQVKIYSSKHEKAIQERKPNEKMHKDIYQLVSPYFDLVNSKTINLKEASISYTVLGDLVPSVYALENVNIYAHDFKLDENSYARGDLLFCKDFEFEINHPQTILSNEHLTFNADAILLSTQDSIVQFKGVSILPVFDLWEKLGESPDEYIQANFNLIELQGTEFSYASGQDHLKARNFLIDSAIIHYYEIKGNKHKKEKIKSDTLPSLSLYKSISPLFSEVAIGNVELNNSKLRFTQKTSEHEDYYLFERLNAYGESFLIDSLTEVNSRNKYWYSENFGFTVNNVIADLPSKNHRLNIDEVFLDTKQHRIKVEGVSVHPYNTRTKEDYLSGSIESLELNDMELENGFNIAELVLKKPLIRYTSSAIKNHKAKIHKTDIDKQSNVLNMLSPFIGHLSIYKIWLMDADLEFNDKKTKNVYSLRNANLSMDDFFIDSFTRKNSPFLFSFDDFNLQFSNFSNYILDKDYRLQVGKASISYKKGDLKLEKVKLIPRKQLKRKQGIYAEFESPLVELKGVNFNEKSGFVESANIDFKTPQINLHKNTTGTSTKQERSKDLTEVENLLKGIFVNALSLNSLQLKYAENSSPEEFRVQLDSLRIDSITTLLGKEYSIGKLSALGSQSSYGESFHVRQTKLHINDLHLTHNLGKFSLGQLVAQKPYLNYFSKDSIHFESDTINIADVNWLNKEGRQTLDWGRFIVFNPMLNISLEENLKPANKKPATPSAFSKLDSLGLGEINFVNANINFKSKLGDKIKVNQKLTDLNLYIRDLALDNIQHKFAVDEFVLNTKDLNFPIVDGFYDIGISSLDFDKKKDRLKLDGISMTSPYLKYDFAYKHPTHADWFNVTADNIELSGIDYKAMMVDTTLLAKHLLVDNVLLENLKNQQIKIEHNIMPMIYNEIHKIPFKFDIDSTDINNFELIYEELPKYGVESSLIQITEMNGRLKGLTNIVRHPKQQINLKANGKWMGTGYFDAEWIMPVSKDYDYFTLEAHLVDFDLRDLNPLLMPMAPVEIKGGYIPEFKFFTEATSKGAVVDMQLLYNNLEVAIYTDAEKRNEKKLYSFFVNRLIQTSNPSKIGLRAREPRVELERNPYHSTFNYFWQILQPPLIESVGISKPKQRYFRNSAGAIVSMGRFFGLIKKEEEVEVKKKD